MIRYVEITSLDGSNTMSSLPNVIAEIGGGARNDYRSYREITGDLLVGSNRHPGDGRDSMPDMRVRLFLIDADLVATSSIRSRLLLQHDFEIVAETSSGEDALRQITALQPDAIFVDLRTLESSGLNVVELLCQSVKPLIVFLGEHTRYALQAFDLGAADYLLKPISDDRFEITLKRIREQLAHRRAAERAVARESTVFPHPSMRRPSTLGRITVTDRKRTHVLETNEIEWISAAGDYTELHVGGATHLLREPLSALIGRLPANVFCRIHRSFVVNLSRVSGFKTLRNQDLLVKLKDRTVLRASRTFSDDLRRAITQQCV
jgi:two-component system, LytTR family, response regulator